ncbi:hypothetical protein MMC10_006009 [Thelotrema lepadinum]|nr:hypothetical protein [Thelotrema lepadinum]
MLLTCHWNTGLLTDEFLDFTSSKGNNLRAAGLTAGCKWCLCASRWKEAMDAAKGPEDPVVPKVFLHATADSALKTVGMDDLKKFAADGENTTGSVRRGVVQNPPKIVNPSVGGTKGGGADN